MRSLIFTYWTLSAILGFAGFSIAADKPRVELSDGKLPLVEMRPLDRRVYVLSLDGKWVEPPKAGKAYFVNVLFPNGHAYNHRPLDDLFRLGEVRTLLQDYQLKRGAVLDGGKVKIIVSEDKPVTAVDAPEVISNVLEVSWPMDRPVVATTPRSRYLPVPATDAFPPISPPERPRPPDPLSSPKPEGKRPPELVPAPKPNA